MPVKSWFPTFIYDAPLQSRGKRAFACSLLADCRAVREQDADGRLWCQDNYPHGYTSYGTLRHLHRQLPRFIALERKIWPHVKRFANHLDMDLREASLAMTDCWVNIMSRQASHPAHVHPGAVFSGTLYVNTPEGCSGLRFEDPRFEMQLGTPPRRVLCRAANQQRITYGAEAGKLVLFESWLRHEVLETPSDGERVSVSFNYTWV